MQSTKSDMPAPVVKSEAEWVTVMIRNLPNNYGRNDAPGLDFDLETRPWASKRALYEPGQLSLTRNWLSVKI